jgi:flavin-dependent dehydrogenase
MRCDVAIVGSGPAGSAAASICARRGLDVVIVDRARFPRYRVGESLHPGMEVLFDALGVGDDIRAAGFPRHAGHWVETGAQLTYQPFGGDEGTQWLGFQALRSRLDRILVASARKAGATVLDGTGAQGIAVGDNGRIVGIQTARGPIEARFTVDAGGDRHWMARRLGLDIIPYSPKLLACFGYARGCCPLRDAAPIFRISKDGSSWLARVGRGVYCWVTVSLSTATSVNIPELSALRPMSRRRGADVTWRILKRTAGRGWFAVGDAAAVCDPAAAQGVLRAISSGMMAGHLLCHAARGAISELHAASVYNEWFNGWFRSAVDSFRSSHDSFYPMMISSRAREDFVGVAPRQRSEG